MLYCHHVNNTSAATMKSCLCLSVSLLMAVASAPVQAASASPAAEPIVGRFENTFSTPKHSLRIVLDCASATECKVTVENSDKGKPDNPADSKSVTLLEEFPLANAALDYVRKQDKASIKSPESLAMLEKLTPLLASSAKLEKCWNLDSTLPGLILACSPDKPELSRAAIYLLIAIPFKECEDGFCDYLIFALDRQPASAPAAAVSAE